jgi:hypothetical protein
MAMAGPRANEYRRRAEECRLQAESARFEEHQESWLKLAAKWLQMAEETDATGQLGNNLWEKRDKQQRTDCRQLLLA